MAPHIDEMRKNIANILDVEIKDVNVKATCAEGLGFVGNKEGALAQAVVLIDDK